MVAHHSQIREFVASRVQDLCLTAFELEASQDPKGQALGAWFLGPKAENADLLSKLVTKAVAHHAQARLDYKPDDPPWITDEVKTSPAYQASKQRLCDQFGKLLDWLNGSVPFFSYRYQGHMLWDTTLPAMLGYFAAMLCNQNNVAAEASPVTTCLEMLVGDDLCRMLGYQVPPERELTSLQSGPGAKQGGTRRQKRSGVLQEPVAWGHITCDGSVANIEALWAARNLKYYPVAVAEALRREPALDGARGLDVKLPTGYRRALVDLDAWQLLNLEADETLGLAARIVKKLGMGEGEFDRIVLPYTLQALGYRGFARRFPDAMAEDAVALVSASGHYSWPKAASLLGVGRKNLIRVPVDLDLRMSLPDLRAELRRCLTERRPVIAVVAVVGTTEESAVDPLSGILQARAEFRKRGLEFTVHVDAAWGGYFASMLPGPTSGAGKSSQQFQADHTLSPRLLRIARLDHYPPELVMSPYVREQYEVLHQADSITVDPHKAGYVPYPAGGLCYRNSAMRHLVAFTAPIVYHGDVDPTVGVYGIEGSKPGAAAAATYLSHRVIRIDPSGYGRILARCMFNSKRLYAALVTMAMGEEKKKEKDFIVAPLQRLPAERSCHGDIDEELVFIRDRIAGKANDVLLADDEAMDRFRQLGSDQIIIGYAFNFRTSDGTANQDLECLNQLNKEIFARLSILKPRPDIPRTPLFITASSLDPEVYGRELVTAFLRRLQVDREPTIPITFLVSTTMDPWLTDTEHGNFIPEIIRELERTVGEAIKAVRSQSRCR